MFIDFLMYKYLGEGTFAGFYRLEFSVRNRKKTINNTGFFNLSCHIPEV